MRYVFAARDGYMKADLFDRRTAQETREFLEALAAEVLQKRHTRVLIHVHGGRPIFKVEEYQASTFLAELGARSAFRVALVAAREDLHAAHEYLELLARQRGASLKSFQEEAGAVAWLMGAAPPDAPAAGAPAAERDGR